MTVHIFVRYAYGADFCPLTGPPRGAPTDLAKLALSGFGSACRKPFSLVNDQAVRFFIAGVRSAEPPRGFCSCRSGGQRLRSECSRGAAASVSGRMDTACAGGGISRLLRRGRACRAGISTEARGVARGRALPSGIAPASALLFRYPLRACRPCPDRRCAWRRLF